MSGWAPSQWQMLFHNTWAFPTLLFCPSHSHHPSRSELSSQILAQMRTGTFIDWFEKWSQDFLLVLDANWDWNQIEELTPAIGQGEWPPRIPDGGSLWVSFGFSTLIHASMEETNATAKCSLRLQAKKRFKNKKAFLHTCSTLLLAPCGNPGPCTSWKTGNKALVFKDMSFWPDDHLNLVWDQLQPIALLPF